MRCRETRRAAPRARRTDRRLRSGLVLLREQVRIANDALIHVRSEMSDCVPLVHLKVRFPPGGAERGEMTQLTGG